MGVAARVELTVASYQKCSRLLDKGEVKRCMQRGPLVGYYLACPACGFSGVYLDEECDFSEQPPKTEVIHDPAKRRKLVGIGRSPSCFRCKRLLRIEEGFLEALDP
jgi:hypothetical protein